DIENTKLIYKLRTCFGCQKYLYCGIYLDQNKCKYPHKQKPTKLNCTSQLTKYNYQIIHEKGLETSWCSACNSAFGRLKSSNIKKLTKAKNIKKTTIRLSKTSDLITDLDDLLSLFTKDISENEEKSDSELESIKNNDDELK
ncbi:18562_t:CDS:2, partial [Funneliformis geosporum]